MQQGWVSIHRSVTENFVWQDKPFNMGAAWIDLILTANHEERKLAIEGHLIIIRRGQTFTSIRSLAEKWGWSKVKVSRYLSLLEQDEMVKLERSKSGTLLTLVNYDNYQDCRDDKRTQSGRKKDTERTQIGRKADDKRTQSGRNNNDNNENNENNENNVNNETKSEPLRFFPNDELLEKTFSDFMEMRKKIRKPMTDRAIELMICKLNKYEPDIAIKMLEQSIVNCWQDVFELKDQSRKQTRDALAEKWGI